jgi:hypothetical protein
MNTQVATKVESSPRTRRSARAVAVLSIGPLAALAGAVWALLQPYRITLLDPVGQGFWWLVSQPPLYLIGVGLFFHAVVAPGVVADMNGEQR